MRSGFTYCVSSKLNLARWSMRVLRIVTLLQFDSVSSDSQWVEKSRGARWIGSGGFTRRGVKNVNKFTGGLGEIEVVLVSLTVITPRS